MQSPLLLPHLVRTLLLSATLSYFNASAASAPPSHIPQIAFAQSELSRAKQETQNAGLQVSFRIEAKLGVSETFRIEKAGSNQIVITGTDTKGAMYGGLEVADRLRLRLPIENGEHEPFIKKRGIKFNIPLDARTPSYDDTGDSAQKNVESVWDFEFWEAYLDDLARNRYNVLSLWTTHPFPSMIKMADYPDVALDDVYRISDDVLRPDHNNKFTGGWVTQTGPPKRLVWMG